MKCKNQKKCKNGHTFYKSSDCPVCPVCEEQCKPAAGFLSKIPAPARRALQSNGIATLKDLELFTEEEILKFHGMGPSTIPKLREALKRSGKKFKE